MNYQELQAVADNYRKVRKEYFEVMKQNFQQVFVDFLKNNKSGIKAIWWKQYTPGFNDGDPCYFQTTDLCFTTKDISAEDIFSEDDEVDENEYGSTNPAILEFREFVGSLKIFDEDIYETLGDGIFVIIKADEMVIEEYDCGY